jgi:hypothetical protein
MFMVVKKYIEALLDDMERKYTSALSSTNPLEPTYYSKLAVLEYCGWIEETFDIIVRRSVKGKIKTTPFKQMLEFSVIGNTYAFQYKEDFRPMLRNAIGISKMEKIEQYLEHTTQLDTLISELQAIKRDRNDAAHTWIVGATKTYPAPSQIKGRLDKVYPIMRNIYREIIKE